MTTEAVPTSRTATPRPPPGRATTRRPRHPPDTPRRPWTVLALMLAAQFMVVLDVSVVNVALPSIGGDLRLSSGDYQWAVSAYVLLSGGLLLLGGRIADLFDRRRMFLTGLALFTAPRWSPGSPTPRPRSSSPGQPRAPARRCSPRPRCRS